MNHHKILIIFGSSRKIGNCTILVDKLHEGAMQFHAVIESICLDDLKIQPCQNCGHCRKGFRNGCAAEDDMQILYSKIRSSDSIVIASPLYCFKISAQMKMFIDKCLKMENLLAGKNMVIILSYEEPDPIVSGAVDTLLFFHEIADYSGARIAGMIYGSVLKVREIHNNFLLMEKAYQTGLLLAANAWNNYGYN